MWDTRPELQLGSVIGAPFIVSRPTDSRPSIRNVVVSPMTAAAAVSARDAGPD